MLIRINRNPEMGNSGGTPEATAQSAALETVSTIPQDSDLGSALSESQPSAGSGSSSKDQAYFEGLKSRLEKNESLAENELDDVLGWIKNGMKPTGEEGGSEDSDAETDEEDPNEPKDVKDAHASAVTETMAKVGAKSIEELPAKIDGLLKLVTEKGSKDTVQINKLTEERDSFSKVAEAQHKLVADLLDGKPEAIAFAQKALGKTIQPRNASGQFAPASQVQSGPEGGDILFSPQEIEASLDPDMLRAVNARMQRLLDKVGSDLAEPKQYLQQEKERLSRERASDGLVVEIETVASKWPDSYGVKSGVLRELVKEYARTGVADPRIQRHVDLLGHAVRHGISLEMAHRDLNFDKVADHTSVVQNARRETAQKILNQTPTVGAAGAAANGGNTPMVTIEDVRMMLDGSKSVPDYLLDANGLIKLSLLPPEVRRGAGLA